MSTLLRDATHVVRAMDALNLLRFEGKVAPANMQGLPVRKNDYVFYSVSPVERSWQLTEHLETLFVAAEVGFPALGQIWVVHLAHRRKFRCAVSLPVHWALNMLPHLEIFDYLELYTGSGKTVEAPLVSKYYGHVFRNGVPDPAPPELEVYAGAARAHYAWSTSRTTPALVVEEVYHALQRMNACAVQAEGLNE